MSLELYSQVDRLLDVGRTREARQLLAPHIATAPDDATAHFYLARAADLDENAPEARKHLSRVLSLDPTHYPGRVLLYSVLFGEKEYADAETIITDLIRENPDDAELLAAYARLMLVTLHVDKATLLVNEALRRDPSNQSALLVQTLVSTVRGDKKAANRTLGEVLLEDPEAARVARTLFYVLLKQRRYREASKVGQQILRAQPNDAELVDALVEIRTQTHWAALPAYPFVRWGWTGVAVAWAIGVFGSRILGKYNPEAGELFSVFYIAICVYSWIYPPILKRWLRTRGL